MISDQELREKLDAIKEELDHALAKASSSGSGAQEPLSRAQAIVEELRSTVPQPTKKHNIMEWWGAGKEIWRGINVDEYLRKERESWHSVG